MDWGVAIILGAAFLPPIALLAFVTFDQARRKLREKPPQTEKLLRPPGYSLSLKFDETFDLIVSDLLKTMLFGTMCGLTGSVVWRSWRLHFPTWWTTTLAVLFALFVVAVLLATLRVFENFKTSRNIRLGMRAEQAVAEALSQVALPPSAALFGFRSFHDLVDEKVGNIDHVTVGPCGVFLIETKAKRRRPSSRNGQKEHEVIYDGKALQLPYGGPDPRPIDQAKVNAKWLSNFLEKETGNPVWVEAIVVLPGWFVEGAGPDDANVPVKVMNANYLVKYLQGQAQSQTTTKKIEPDQVQRIVNALDKKCRTVDF